MAHKCSQRQKEVKTFTWYFAKLLNVQYLLINGFWHWYYLLGLIKPVCSVDSEQVSWSAFVIIIMAAGASVQYGLLHETQCLSPLCSVCLLLPVETMWSCALRWQSITGEKKQQRKEQIAAKRQIRAQCRGFDLAAVNAVQSLSVTESAC